jgi:hypothetical protein
MDRPVQSNQGISCLVGCLIVLLIFVFILAVLLGSLYYFIFLREKEPGSYFDLDPITEETVNCEDSLSCLEDNFKECLPAKGEAEMGDFADVELEVLGTSGGDGCVVYAKIIKVNQVPPGLEPVPDFMLEKMFENLSMECLVPEEIYNQDMESIGNYIGENIYQACKGSLFDWAERFGVNLEDIN